MLFSTGRNCPIGSCWGQDQVKECTARGIRPVLFMFQQLLCGNSNHVIFLQGAGSKCKRGAPAVGDEVANAISNMMLINDTVAECAANRAAKRAAAEEALGSASAAGAAAEDDDEGDEDELSITLTLDLSLNPSSSLSFAQSFSLNPSLNSSLNPS